MLSIRLFILIFYTFIIKTYICVVQTISSPIILLGRALVLALLSSTLLVKTRLLVVEPLSIFLSILGCWLTLSLSFPSNSPRFTTPIILPFLSSRKMNFSLLCSLVCSDLVNGSKLSIELSVVIPFLWWTATLGLR